MRVVATALLSPAYAMLTSNIKVKALVARDIFAVSDGVAEPLRSIVESAYSYYLVASARV